jgi:uncharacterized protein
MTTQDPADCGAIGLGLRSELIEAVRDDQDLRRPDFLEIFPHHFQGRGGRLRRDLQACQARYPIVAHCTGASLGGYDPLDDEYLDTVAAFMRDSKARWWSDHFCWSGHGGAHFDLLPLPFTRASVSRLAARARAAQGRVGAQLALENVSAYVRCPEDEVSEAEFCAAVLDEADVGMLLDVNNVIVNCLNFGGDPHAFIDTLPLDRVLHIHVSGHTVLPHVVIDTHVCPVPDSVWELYRYTLARAGRMIPTVLEWDTDIAPYEQVLAELDHMRTHAAFAMQAKAS